MEYLLRLSQEDLNLLAQGLNTLQARIVQLSENVQTQLATQAPPSPPSAAPQQE